MSSTVLIPAAATYASDPIHTTFAFEVRHNGVAAFKSTFREASATLRSNGETFSVEGEAKVESIDISLPPFREHVLSDGFLGAEEHPLITFRSTAARLDGVDLEVDGELSIRGVTRPITARGTLSPAVANPFGGTVLGLRLAARVDRTEFGIDWNMDLPAGGKVLDNEVSIVVEGELVAES